MDADAAWNDVDAVSHENMEDIEEVLMLMLVQFWGIIMMLFQVRGC